MDTIIDNHVWEIIKEFDIISIHYKYTKDMIYLSDFVTNKNILHVNYFPTGLKKLYDFYLNFYSYLPNTLNTITFITDNNYISLDKLPYSLRIIQISFDVYDEIKCNLINLNLNQLLHVFIKEYDDYYITETKNYIQYDYYINLYFTRIKSDSVYILHLRNLKN